MHEKRTKSAYEKYGNSPHCLSLTLSISFYVLHTFRLSSLIHYFKSYLTNSAIYGKKIVLCTAVYWPASDDLTLSPSPPINGIKA